MLRTLSTSFLRRPLMLFLIVGVLPVLLVGLLAYQRSSASMRAASYELLDQVRETRRAQVVEYFEDRASSLRLLASLHDTTEAMDLLEAWEADNPLAEDAPVRTDDESFKVLLAEIDALFAPFIATDEFHDIFLIDLEHGHVMYSVAKETDLGTNLASGPLRGSGLAEAWRAARDRRDFVITDQAWYEPSREDSLFIAIPAAGSSGADRALLAAQIGADELHSIMAGTSELGESGEVFLVGPDRKLRSQLRHAEGINTDRALDGEAISLALEHTEGVIEAADHAGVPVLAAYSHLGLDDALGADVEWVIIAEISQEEALTEARALALWLLGVTGLIALMVLAIAWAVARALKQQTTELLEGISVLAASGAQISATSSQLAVSATETASAVAETTVTMEELKQTTQMSLEKARAVSESAGQSVQSAQAGARAVDRTVARMSSIRQQMETVAESVVRLSEQSQAIGEIISAVDDLAEQSNLLAVNAAIEAAKAGEHGKGFAVVAQEVKSLAEQSKQATAHVRTILNDIQKATSVAVMATEQGNKAVEAGVEQSSEAGEAITVLGDGIHEASQAASQIAASAQQQFVGVEQVTEAMEGIKVAAEQNELGARQLEDAVRDLDTLGKRLQELASRYQARG
jgi:methyl-accepting chemotaxis protein